MNRPVLTIGLSDEVNAAFEKYIALDQVSLIACKDISEAMVLITKMPFRLIIYDAAALGYDEVQDMVCRVRRIVYTPMVVLCIDEAAAATQKVGADICVPPNMEIHRLFSTAMSMARRNECFRYYDNAEPGNPTLYRGDLMIDSSRHEVTQAGREIRLNQREFRLLAFFAKNAGLVLTPEQFGPAIWVKEHNYNRDVAKVVSNLRQNLGDQSGKPVYIETIRNFGYRFIPTK